METGISTKTNLCIVRSLYLCLFDYRSMREQDCCLTTSLRQAQLKLKPPKIYQICVFLLSAQQ